MKMERTSAFAGMCSASDRRGAYFDDVFNVRAEPPRDSWRLFGLSQAAIVVA